MNKIIKDKLEKIKGHFDIYEEDFALTSDDVEWLTQTVEEQQKTIDNMTKIIQVLSKPRQDFQVYGFSEDDPFSKMMEE
jgi:hypothetical protein